MGSMETNDAVHTWRLHLMAKIKEKTQTQALSVNKNVYIQQSIVWKYTNI